ncbi:MAG TPA: hypothetical protein VFW98_18545 [Gemmatimonadaceae bacterium]|nr:hypothetical protein [Gemmatimonadaceae bacterium]
MRYTALLSAVILAIPLVGHAQVTTVDEGSFTIYRGSSCIGHETFTIRRSAKAGGAVFIASATVQIASQQLAPALRTDSAGSPLAYQVEVRTGSRLQERLSGQIGRGRFSARVVTPRGESAKEYIVSDGAIVLDDDVFHQYYFLAHRSHSGAVPVVIPRRNAQIMMHVKPDGQEELAIGGDPLMARHLTLTAPNGDTRQLWVDPEGRVLKVQLQAQGVTAVRDEPPG